MKPWVKKLVFALAGVLVLLVVCAATVYAVSASRLSRTVEATAHAIRPASADIVEGKRLANAYGCTECHGADLGGTLLVDGMPFAIVPAPNLTSGRAGGALADEQWELAVRHGIGADGHALFIMPSPEYAHFGDSDLEQIVAYARTLPPVTDTLPERSFGPVGRMLVTLNRLPFAPDLIPADVVHAKPEVAVTTEFGHYLTRLCTGCHGAALSGGPPEQVDPAPGPDLTTSGPTGSWTLEQFTYTLRTGQTPDGRSLDPALMPWRATAFATDTEIAAIWTYLRSLPPGGSPP